MAGRIQRSTMLGTSVYFLLLAIGGVMTTSGFYDNVPHVCKNRAVGETVRLPSKRCDAYIECFAGMAFLRLCAPGTSFNPKTVHCDLPRGTDCNHQGGHQFHGSEVHQFRHLFVSAEDETPPTDTEDATILEDDTKSDDSHTEATPLPPPPPMDTKKNKAAKTNEFYLNPTIVVTGPAKLNARSGPVRRRYIRSVEGGAQRGQAPQNLQVAAAAPKLHDLSHAPGVPAVKAPVEGKSFNPQVQNTVAQVPVQSVPRGRQGMNQAQLQQLYHQQMMQQQQQQQQQMPNQQQFPQQMPNQPQMQQFQQQQMPNQQQVPQPMPNQQQQFQQQQQMQQGPPPQQQFIHAQQQQRPQFQGPQQQQMQGTGLPQGQRPYLNYQAMNSGSSNNVNTHIRPMMGNSGIPVQGKSYQQPRQNPRRNYKRPRGRRNRFLFPSFRLGVKRSMRPSYHPQRRMTSSSYPQPSPTRTSSYSDYSDFDSFSPSSGSSSMSNDEKMMNSMFEKLKTTTMDESLDMVKDNDYFKSSDIPKGNGYYNTKVKGYPEEKSIDLSGSLPDYTFPYEKKSSQKASQGDDSAFIRANDGFTEDYKLKQFPEYNNYSTSPSDPYAGVSNFYDTKDFGKSNNYRSPKRGGRYNGYRSPKLRGAKAFAAEYDDNYSKYAQSNNKMYGPDEYTHGFGDSDDAQSSNQGEQKQEKNSAPAQTPIWIHPFANGGSVFSDEESQSQGSRDSGDYPSRSTNDRDNYDSDRYQSSDYPSSYKTERGYTDDDYHKNSYPSKSSRYDSKQGEFRGSYDREDNDGDSDYSYRRPSSYTSSKGRYSEKSPGYAKEDKPYSPSSYSHRGSESYKDKPRSGYSKDSYPRSSDGDSYSSDYRPDKQSRGRYRSDNYDSGKKYDSNRDHDSNRGYDSHRDYDRRSESNRDYDSNRNDDSDRDYDYNRDDDSQRQYESRDDRSQDRQKEKDDPYVNEKNREKSHKPTDPDSYYNADNPGPFSTNDPGYPYNSQSSSASNPEGSEGGGPENQDEGGSHAKYGRKPPTFDSFPFNFMPKHLTGPMFTNSGSMDFKDNAGMGHVAKMDLDENGDVQYDDTEHRVGPVQGEGDKDKYISATVERKHQSEEKADPNKVTIEPVQDEEKTEPSQVSEDKAKSRKKRHTGGYPQSHYNSDTYFPYRGANKKYFSSKSPPRSNPKFNMDSRQYSPRRNSHSYPPRTSYSTSYHAPRVNMNTQKFSPGTSYGARQFTPRMGSKNYPPSTNYGTQNLSPRMGSKNYPPSTNYGTQNLSPRMGSKNYPPSTNYGTQNLSPRMGSKNYPPSTNYGTQNFSPRMGSKYYSPSTNYGTHKFAPKTTFGTRNLAPSANYNTNQWALRNNINTRQFATHTNYATQNLAPRMGSKNYSPSTNYGTQNFAPKTTFGTRNIAPRTSYNTNQWAPKRNLNTRQFAPKLPQQAPKAPKAPNIDHFARAISTNYHFELPLLFDGGVADPTRGEPTTVLKDIEDNTVHGFSAKVTEEEQKDDSLKLTQVTTGTSGDTGATGVAHQPGAIRATGATGASGGTEAAGATGATGAPGEQAKSRKKRHSALVTAQEENKYDSLKLTHDTKQPLDDVGYGGQWPVQEQNMKGYGDTFYNPSGTSVPYNTFGAQGNYGLGGKTGSPDYDFKGDTAGTSYYATKPANMNYPPPIQPFELEKFDMNFETITPSPKTQKQIFLETIHLSPDQSDFLNPQQRSGDGFFDKDSTSDYNYGQDKWSDDKWSDNKWSDDVKWSDDKWPRESWADNKFSSDKWGDDKWSGNSKWSDVDKYPDFKTWTAEDDVKWASNSNSQDWSPFSGGSNPRFDLKKGSAYPVGDTMKGMGKKTLPSSKSQWPV